MSVVVYYNLLLNYTWPQSYFPSSSLGHADSSRRRAKHNRLSQNHETSSRPREA